MYDFDSGEFTVLDTITVYFQLLSYSEGVYARRRTVWPSGEGVRERDYDKRGNFKAKILSHLAYES